MCKKEKTFALPFVVLLLAMIAGCTSQRSAKLMTAGDSQMLAGNFPSAAEQYQKAQKLKETDKIQLRLVMATIKEGKFTEALAKLDKITQASPKADYLRAVCYLGLNDVANAQRNLERALGGNPNDSIALALLGRIKFLQKQHTQSIEAYRTALATSSDEGVRTKLYYNLAMAQLLAGEFTQADNSFKNYLVKQNFVTAEDNRLAGAIAHAVGDHQRALRHWQKLNGKEKQEILNAIADESQMYEGLVVAK